MLMIAKARLEVLLAALLAVAVAAVAHAQSQPAARAKATLPPAALSVTLQEPPEVSVAPREADKFEYNESILQLPRIVARQWSPLRTVAPEGIISQNYLTIINRRVRRMTLKEALYGALKNNPIIAAARLDPIAATEAVRMAYGMFDPDLIMGLDVIKTAVPATTALQVGGESKLTTKHYDWNFTVNKLLPSTNGRLSLLFNNDWLKTNNLFQNINPGYIPSLTLSLSQPLLRGFGWRFATISVQLAEAAQKQSQWNYAQQLSDFVQRVGTDYWSVVGAEENLKVAQSAYKFNQDLVNVNAVRLTVGTIAPLDLHEAQAAAATAQANVYTAEAARQDARAVLRADVMHNPTGAFVPDDIVAVDKPNPNEPVMDEEERSLELVVKNRETLAAMRQAVRLAQRPVKYMENQFLPQVNLGSQFGMNSFEGNTLCAPIFGSRISRFPFDCANPRIPLQPGEKTNGTLLPFKGGYADALRKFFSFQYYNYAVYLGVEMPLDNAPLKAALGQAKVAYEQSRMQYRAALSRSINEVEAALATLGADIHRIKAAKAAEEYARQALLAERARFEVGTATTHDLLQYQNSLVATEGNEVQAEVDLENAKLALRHATGTLLASFQVKFQLNDPHEMPWYAHF